MHGKPVVTIKTEQGHLSLYIMGDRVDLGPYTMSLHEFLVLAASPEEVHDECCPGDGECCDREHCDDYTCECETA